MIYIASCNRLLITIYEYGVVRNCSLYMFPENDPITEASCVGASCDKTIGAIYDMSQISPVTLPHTVTACPNYFVIFLIVHFQGETCHQSASHGNGWLLF